MLRSLQIPASFFALISCAAVLVNDPCLGQQPGKRKVFANSIVPLPNDGAAVPLGLNVHALDASHDDDKLEVLFSLQLPPDLKARLEERVAKGETIPLEELDKTFAVPKVGFDKLVAWLKKERFDVTYTSDDRTSVYATATVAQIERSLQVDMVRVTSNGMTYNAARNAPSLPGDVGNPVFAIIGLQPFRQAHKNARGLVPIEDPTEITGPTALSPTIANKPPYLASEILEAYNAHNLKVTGKGQKIAILIDTFADDADLAQFWKRSGITVAKNNIEKVNVGGGALPPREGEETLDVEWSSAIAPGAVIRVYASGSLQFTALDKALDRIYADLKTHPTMRQLSISLGLGEKYMPGGLSGEIATQNAKFLKLCAAGVNVFVSSGDAGSNPDATGHGGKGPLQVEYQSSDTYVIGVGGTSVYLSSGGTVIREEAWSGSGGGKSAFFKRPTWQKGPGIAAGTERLVPDVGFAADPTTGAYVFYQGQSFQYGGTSWSAPVWAGICALLNEARSNAGKPSLPYLNPLLYPLGGSSCFRDVTVGSNGTYKAGKGHDMVTGWGVPNVAELVKALTK